MNKNIGNLDKTLRIACALIIAGLSYFNIITGVLEITLLVIAIIFLVTSLLNFCPLYKIFRHSSCKKE